MEINPLRMITIVVMASLLIEKVFYYISLYRKKNNNPGYYGERIGKLETSVENVEEDIKRIKDKLDLI